MTDSPWSSRDFENLYASVGDDLDLIPWASQQPHPALVSWLDGQPAGAGRDTLVVGCGLGDDAAELALRGYRVSAFDYSATAIGWCRRRFPGSPVDYRVVDLFDLPAAWNRRFDLVVEINTIQSVPVERRRETVAAIAGAVAPGGFLFLRCLGRGDDDPAPERPWAVSRRDLRAFRDEGLRETAFTEEVRPTGRSYFNLVFAR